MVKNQVTGVLQMFSRCSGHLGPPRWGREVAAPSLLVGSMGPVGLKQKASYTGIIRFKE